MYVCICNAVTEDDIVHAVDSGAECVRAICRSTLAGTSCGTCFRRVQSVAAKALQDRRAPAGAATSGPSLRVVS